MPRRPNGDTQQRILEYIEKYIDENGFPPSVREIGLAVDLKSTSTVHGHLTRLEKKGLLHREAMKPRTIVKKEEKPQMVKVPLLGKVVRQSCCNQHNHKDGDDDDVFPGCLDLRILYLAVLLLGVVPGGVFLGFAL